MEETIKVKGIFEVEVEIVVDAEDMEKLKNNDLETIAAWKQLIGESAQETVAYGNDVYIITESPIASLMGTTFLEEKEEETE
jgi:hypothetical protein